MATASGLARDNEQAVKLFVSYAHEDEHLARQLNLLLAPLRHKLLLSSWHDREISPGVKWEEQLLRKLDEADIVVLIVTPAYLDSIYSLQTELRRSLERQERERVRIVPVIGRLCFWKDFPELSALQVLPKDGEPIELNGKIREPLLINAAEGIIQAAKEIATLKSGTGATLPDNPSDPNAGTSAKRRPVFSRSRVVVLASLLLIVAAAVALILNPPSKPNFTGETPGETPADRLESGKELIKQKKYTEAVPILRRADMSGSGEADDYLGWLYLTGRGVPQDYKAAENWFAKADKRGNSSGTNHLGLLYETSLDYETALKLFRKAESQGNGDAMNNLGWMYLSGWAVPENPMKAREYFEKSANHGSGNGMNNLGWLYENGIAVPKQDYDRAFTWFKKGADQQNARAMNSLGWMLLNGWGKPKNFRKAMEWFQKAADCDDDLGRGMAMNNLGWIYEMGMGVSPDKGKAIYWYKRSAAVGNVLAKLSVERLDKA